MRRDVVLGGLVLVLLVSSAQSLFDDQAGSFDWYKQHVGQVFHAALHKTKPRVAVATRQGVIASLNLRDGSIGWRNVLSDADPLNTVAVLERLNAVVSVSSGGKQLRAWDLADGSLKWSKPLRGGEVLLAAVPGPDDSSLAAVWTSEDLMTFEAGSGTLMDKKALPSQVAADGAAPVRHMVVLEHQLLLLSYAAGDVELNVSALEDGRMQQAAWTAPMALSANCAAGPAGFAAISADGSHICFLQTVAEGPAASDVPLEAAFSCVAVATLAPKLPPFAPLVLRATPVGFLILSAAPGSPGVALISRSAARADGMPGPVVLAHFSPTAAAASDAIETEAGWVVGLVSLTKPGSVSLSVVSLSTGKVAHSETVPYAPADNLVAGCAPRSVAGAVLGSFRRKDKSEGFRLLLTWQDAQLALLQQGTVVWVREEAMASASAAHFVELPAPPAVSGGVALAAPTAVTTSLRYRFQVLSVKVQLKLNTPEEADELVALRSSMSDKNLAVRDGNGFRQLILVLTGAGKLLALHTGDGRIMWSRTYAPDAAPDRLLPWRTFHDVQHSPQVLLLFSGAGGSYASIVDAHSGREVERLPLGYGVDQLLQLQVRQQAGHVDQVVYMAVAPPATPGAAPHLHLLPSDAESRAHLAANYRSLYFWRHDAATDTLTGFGLDKATAAAATAGAAALPSVQVWRLEVPGTILALTSRDATESIHSSVKVLSDHSIKYRYLNPNTLIVAVGSAAGAHAGHVDPYDGSGGPRLTLHIVDTVTGRVLHRQSHSGARGPVHAVATENLVVYQYFDTVAARFVVTSMELYDATPRDFNVLDYLFNPNSTRPITSFLPPPLEVVSQSYFTRLAVTQIALTRTLRGLTAKQLLLATDNSQVYMLDKRFVDPRRPMRKLTTEEQEERVVPYADTLPYMPTAFVTYDRQVAGLRAIAVAPSRLESTCHLLVLGVDAHYTRLAPSRAFDSLEDDFSYGLLVLLLASLAAGCGALHEYTKRASLKSKWK